jgi:hypothetical protein
VAADVQRERVGRSEREGELVRAEDVVIRHHAPEPAVGTIRTSDGQQADLFNISHYPVLAVCRVCSEPIRAESFLRPFAHYEEEEPLPF